MAVPVREPHRDYVGEKCAPRARPLTVNVNTGPAQALSTSESLPYVPYPFGVRGAAGEKTQVRRFDVT